MSIDFDALRKKNEERFGAPMTKDITEKPDFEKARRAAATLPSTKRGGTGALPTAGAASTEENGQSGKSALGRIGSGLKSIGVSMAGSIPMLWETAAQSVKDAAAYEKNRNTPEGRALTRELSSVNAQLRHLNPGSPGYEEMKSRYDELQSQMDEVKNFTTLDEDNSLGMRLMGRANELQQEAVEGMSPVGSFLGGTAISIGQNLAALPTAILNPAAPLAVIGTQAAAGKAYEVSEAGGTADEALTRGLVSGGIEAATEKIGLDNLMEIIETGGGKALKALLKRAGVETTEEALKTGGKAALKTLLEQAGVEATEEGVSYVANYVMDKAVKDPNARFDPAELAESMAAGGLSGLFFAGAGMGTHKLGKKLGLVTADDVAAQLREAGAEEEQVRELAPTLAAVLNGEEISGNQAAAVARNETAVSILENATGESVNTDAPLGEVKKTVRETAQRRSAALAQETTVDTTAQENAAEGLETALPRVAKEDADLVESIRQVRRAAAALGENGSKALSAAYDTDTARTVSAVDAVEGFYQVYNAALNSKAAPESKLPAHMRLAAESAGARDAARAAQATYFGEKAGLVRDASWKKAHLSSKTERSLDALGKTLGVEIRFADSVEGGRANAQYKDGVITLALDGEDPVMTCVTHEAVHRIRETAPEAYQVLADFVRGNMTEEGLDANLNERQRLYQTDSVDIATEEMVADAFGRMLEDGKAVERLVKEDRSLAQRVRDTLRDIVNAVKRALGHQNLRLSQEQKAAFRELESRVTAMEGLFTEALNASGRDTTLRTGGDGATMGTQYSSKEDGKRGREEATRTGTFGNLQREAREIDGGTGKAEQRVRRELSDAAGRHGGVNPSFGAKPVRSWVEGHTVEPARGSVAYAEQQTAIEYGVPSFVVSDTVYTENKSGAPAFSAGGQIYFQETLPEKNRGMFAPHEITHVMRQVGYAPYLDFVDRTPTMLNMSDPVTRILLDHVAKHQRTTLEDANPTRLYDEFNATMYGHIAAGKAEMFTSGDGTGVFHNFAAYAEELTAIHEQFKQHNQKEDAENGIGQLHPEKRVQAVQQVREKSEVHINLHKVSETDTARGAGERNLPGVRGEEGNEKVKFSLKSPVEETRELLALHNLNEDSLLGDLELGGLPMPSIAVVKAKSGHAKYGDISLVFSKDTIDPQFFRTNKVYGGDAWTPTFPAVEYKVNEKALRRVRDAVNELTGGSETRRKIDRLLSLDTENMADALNRNGGDPVAAFRDSDGLKYAYLRETNPDYAAPTTGEPLGRNTGRDDGVIIALADTFGIDAIQEMRQGGYAYFNENKDTINEMLDVINRYYREHLDGYDEDVFTDMSFSEYDRLVSDVYSYAKNGRKQTVDTKVLREYIAQNIDQGQYEAWLGHLFDGIVEKKGIRNEKDLFTPQGNRRSFDALHYEVSLENIVKAMKKDTQKGGGTLFGGASIWGVATKDYSSIQEIKDDSWRLGSLPEEEYNAIRDQYTQRLYDLTTEIRDPRAHNSFLAADDAASIIIDTLRKKRTVAAIDKELRAYPQLNIRSDTAEKALTLFRDIANMPTGYFEAKPQRAVGFDEVLAAVIPSDSSEKLRLALAGKGVNVLTYESGNEADRLAKVNSVEKARFSLKGGETARETAKLRDTTLRTGRDGATMGTQYSLKEDLEHGRARKEKRRAFLRRASGEGYGIYEGETTAYGYRAVQGKSAKESARVLQEEVKKLGVEADIVDGEILWNHDGVTGVRAVPQAVTVEGGRIFVSADADMAAREVAGHEAFHAWKDSAGRDAYIEVLEDNLLFASTDFLEYQNTVAETYLGGEADLTDTAQMERLREELFAYISGHIHDGTNDEFLRPMFRDYDAVKAAWEGLVENHSNDGKLSLKTDRELLNEYVRKYGAIPKGETPSREILLPRKTGDGKNVSQTVRTILEAGATPEEIIPDIERLVAQGDFSYDRYTDRQAIDDARGRIQRDGWDQALRDWEKAMKSGEVSKENTAMGWALYNNAANSGNTKTALDILGHMVAHQRNAAQALQATRILKRMSPETQLYQAQKSVESLQRELNERYGEKKAPELKIDQDLAERYLRAENQESRDAALRDIYRDIGRQMPSRFRDRWNAWRYLSMLGNPRTHVRNVVGNAGFAPVVAAKDLTATAIEAAVSRASGGKLERSKALVGPGRQGRALLKAAWNDYATVQETALGGGKYSDFANVNRYVEEGRKIFGNTRFEVWNKTGGKALETARKANSAALDAEDVWFSQPHYAYALAQYCKANGITAEAIAAGADLKKARNYAILEAQKATYRDTNAFSTMVSDLGRDMSRGKNPASKALGMVMEGILPFRKTPANILARGVEYSPLGLVKSLTADLRQVRHGRMTGAEMIDRLSAGLTGTGLLGLGAYLAAQGLIRGKGPGDDEEREFAELQGHQAYSLELGNTSITLDWLAPEALPFFVGVNLWETTRDTGGGVTLAQILEAVGNVSEPMLEMSCLQSLNDVLDSVGQYGSEGVGALPSVLADAATSYLTQGLPTLLGQFERTMEDRRYTTYTQKSAFLTTDAQYFLGKVSGKVPSWEYQQIPYIDAWGRVEMTGSTGQRAFNNFLNPAYTSKIDTSAMEEELTRLYRATDDSDVLPARAAKSFTIDGEKKELTAEEYVRYATLKGQTSYELVRELTKSKVYQRMNDEEKAESVKNAYTLANQQAKAAISDYEPQAWVEKAAKAKKKYGIGQEVYVALKTQAADIESLKDENGDTIANSESLRIMELVYNTAGLNDEQRQAMFEYLGVGKTVRHLNKAAVKEKLEKMRRGG